MKTLKLLAVILAIGCILASPALLFAQGSQATVVKNTVDNKEVVLTDADVSYEWLTPHHDWKDTNPEVLAVTYLRSKNKISSDAAISAAAAAVTPSASTSKKKSSTKKEPATDLPGESGHRKYLGYIVRIYYNDQLQAVRADPTKLLNLFPPPFTAPSQ